MKLCPCGQEMKKTTKVRLDQEVDVLSCPCGREREVIVYGKFDKAKTSHEKFVILAEELY